MSAESTNTGPSTIEPYYPPVTEPTSLPDPAPAESPAKQRTLTIKVTGIERVGKKDPIIKFDVHSTLPGFRTTTFRDVRRYHKEFIRLFEHLNGNNLQCFVPSVPPPYTSFGAGSEEDEIYLKANMQKWLNKIAKSPILSRDEEIIYFIETDQDYIPLHKRRPPATGLRRKAMKQLQPPPDDCIELANFRPLVKSFYLSTQDVCSRLEAKSKAMRTLGSSINYFGKDLSDLADIEAYPAMAALWKKFGKTIMSVGDVCGVNSTCQIATLGDGLKLLSKDAYVMKETLTNRHLLMRDLLSAQQNSKSKHQTASKLRGSTQISPAKVDEAIRSLEDAKVHEENLTNQLVEITDNLLSEKAEWYTSVEAEISACVADYARRVIDAERKTLAIWEMVRPDVRNADPTGGLSRLGRSTVGPANSATAPSQGPSGDSWSGERRRPRNTSRSFAAMAPGPASTANDSESAEDTPHDIDARQAASLLAGSSF
ncbi:hypothetical protein CANCADRAFT_116463 [Tortispora caseinolytica NRRL Y-17796]|uniref:Vacuolar protein sorting-associated protein 17 n=1 Tax=Tortispora caseinolytica NRRL Y-17796 TaxID=767744 RepID=A0A1E4TH68_9ASCO|nr:hypothetical protein CANCADRAFT_116463 [Tortispora caseinolytica NRRL Y-17796]